MSQLNKSTGMSIDQLYTQWMSLIKIIENTNSDRTIFEEYWNIIRTSYTESHRYYHNLQHIAECLELYNQIESQLENQYLVEIALWFHDIIYKPKSRNNERDSNQIALKFADSIGLNIDEKTKLSNLILGTINHRLELVNSIDIQYMIDIDLAILGSESNRFWEYEHQICNEFSFAPRILYKRTRGKIMKKFLKRDYIYTTKYFIDNYETAARSNIQNLLEFYTNT